LIPGIDIKEIDTSILALTYVNANAYAINMTAGNRLGLRSRQRRPAQYCLVVLSRTDALQVCASVRLPNATGAFAECSARWFDSINHCPVLLAGACFSLLFWAGGEK
jgi:hypothetical protein